APGARCAVSHRPRRIQPVHRQSAHLRCGPRLRPAYRGTMLDYLLDIQRVNQYFKWPLGAKTLWEATSSDLEFLRQVRTGLLPLPTDRPREFQDPFPAPRRRRITALADKRVAVIATGGSGALASMVGVVRVLEEAGVQPTAYGVCSGSAL